MQEFKGYKALGIDQIFSHPDKMANETGENGLEKKVSDLTGVAFSAILLFKVK